MGSRLARRRVALGPQTEAEAAHFGESGCWASAVRWLREGANMAAELVVMPSPRWWDEFWQLPPNFWKALAPKILLPASCRLRDTKSSGASHGGEAQRRDCTWQRFPLARLTGNLLAEASLGAGASASGFAPSRC